MFEQAFVNVTGPSRRPWTMAASAAVQGALIGGAVLFTVVHTAALPQRIASISISQPPMPGTEPAAKRVVVPIARGRVIRRGALVFPTNNAAPVQIIDTDAIPVMGGTAFAGPASGGDICPGCLTAGTTVAPPPPPPVERKPVAEVARIQRIRIGGGVETAKLVTMVRPVFPPLARQARISGVVRLEAIINRDGTIQNLRVASGHPLLAPAALEAVRQWRYQPTLLNGDPVEVSTVIDVHFLLGQ
ncbi:MAG: TonB family protein [Bryobacteraceae bacterium]